MDRYPSAQTFVDGDVEMIPLATAMDQDAGSLRQLREQFEYDDGDIQMESAFEFQDDPLDTNQACRLMIIDTNILISHLSLIEWLGELLIAARKLQKRSHYRCGLLIPKMVRDELDKHKMPHNKQRTVTALLEPPLVNPSRHTQTSMHSPEGLALGRRAFSNTNQSVKVSLYEAADQALKWMLRLYKNTPPDCAILTFQTKNQVADPTLTKVSPDMHILDCATYFKEQLQVRGGGISLLTNDKALSLEAELEGLSTLRVQPGLSPRSLLQSFDPALGQEIDTLIAKVSLADMITASWYKKTSIPSSKSTRRRTCVEEISTANNTSSSAHHHPKADSKPNDVLSNNMLSLIQEIPKADEPTPKNDQSSTHMAIEIDEEMALSDLDVPPLFLPVAYQHMLAPAQLYEPRLLHLHYHIQQAVAALLRPRLFEFLLCKLARNDMTLLFQHVALAFARLKKVPSPIPNSHDPNEWTAVDCLTLIDEFWNEATLKLFEDEHDNQSTSQTKNGSSHGPRPDTTKLSISRWAPSTPYMNSDTKGENCKAFSNRLSRTRKAIQVLIVQLQPYDLSNLPRDNPQSWSVLFWDGLLEDIHKLIYYGKFFESLSLVEDGREFKDQLLKNVIHNWKRTAHHLCESDRTPLII
ncbi:hypothetical protein MJO29_014599 [Puccinia striiformis f. sp. tritici]|nr:hypothetical protein MJO29_014599 [Puccinia striiformis f. sp. tritici]